MSHVPNGYGGRQIIEETVASGESVTTEWVDMASNHYNSAEAFCRSGSGGGELEMRVQFSHTGDEADGVGVAGPWYTTASFSGTIGIPRVVRRTARYVRAVVTNTSDSAVDVVGYLYLNNAVASPTIQRATSAYTDDYDALNVRQVTDPRLDEAGGRALDRIAVNKFGANRDVGATAEVVWTAGGAYTGWLSTASAVRVRAGGDAADTAAGAGARSVTVEGLDEGWALASETIDTAGASASAATTTTFVRVFRAYVATAGTYATPQNTGTIDIETTGGTLVAEIVATEGQSQQAVYTVPDGYTFYLRQLTGTLQTGKGVRFQIYQRQNADTTTAPVTSRRLVREQAGSFIDALQTYIAIPARTDIWLEATTTSGSTSEVAGGFDGILVKDR